MAHTVSRLKVIRTVSEMMTLVVNLRARGKSVALVPTMGSLHAGHLALVTKAAELADQVIVSIFVNPAQFGPEEDLTAYPRDLTGDIETLFLEDEKCVVFAPSTEEIYPDGRTLTWVYSDGMGEHLCGASRPTHFRGVQTVVTKLLNICTPDFAVFGLKDVQQFFLIRRMVKDLNIAVEIVGVPTIRELDGLAMSSRNLNLSDAERQQATILFSAITEARKSIEEGERVGERIESELRSRLERATLGRVDYAQLVRSRDLTPVVEIQKGEEVITAVALFFERARLIDNAIITAP